MAKVRLYQLARELGVDNNELMEKLKSLGVDAKNHMATLADGEVDQVRALYRQAQEVKVDEVRIRPTVIRRRRKVEARAEEPAAEPAPATERAEEPAVAAAVPEAAPSEPKPTEVLPGPLLEMPPVEVVMPGPAIESVSPETVAEGARAKEAAEPAGRERVLPVEPISPAEARAETARTEEREDKGKKLFELLKKPARVEEPAEEAGRAGKKGKPFSGRKVVEYKPRRGREPSWEGGPDKELPQKEEGEVRRDRRPSFRRPALKPVITVPKPIKRKIRVGESILVGELAKRMGVKAAEIIKRLMQNGVMSNINQPVDTDMAATIAGQYGYEIERVQPEETVLLNEQQDRPESMSERPPVVTIMGHVNHGKTRLLDAIRKTNVMESEAGGITQHIGAYKVSVADKTIVFLDTPGHEAFTKMRARGATVTDIVVLVVAADDGVMPQTLEAINHARAAHVPILVAVNKIDLPSANVDRVKQMLAEHKLVPEAWGGDTLFAEISAKEGIGIQELLELILLQAEIMELKANPDKRVKGVIIEARLDRTLGPVATVLVREGSLRVGDPFVTGLHYGKVRALLNDRGERVSEAGPSVPVEVLGCSGVPEAGDPFVVVEDDKKAKLLSSLRMEKARQTEVAAGGKMSLDELYEKIRAEEVKDLNIILKADVQGSVEALSGALERLGNEKVKTRVLHGGVGGVTETDVMLASASNALILAFSVRAEPKALHLAEQEKVDLRFYSVIYDAVSDIQAAMQGMLEPVFKEVPMGRAEVRETFGIPKVGTVAGSYILDGKMERNAKVRVMRDSVVIYEGKVASLRRFKEDAKEVMAGYECGIRVESFNDVKVGDILEAYSLQQVSQSPEDRSRERRPAVT
ncbi:MAG: translation initiation factor IF-2 [bacterium]